MNRLIALIALMLLPISANATVTTTKTLTVQRPEYDTGMTVTGWVDVKSKVFVTSEERTSALSELRPLAKAEDGRIILTTTSVDDKNSADETLWVTTTETKVLVTKTSKRFTVTAPASVWRRALSAIGDIPWAQEMTDQIKAELRND